MKQVVLVNKNLFKGEIMSDVFLPLYTPYRVPSADWLRFQDMFFDLEPGLTDPDWYDCARMCQNGIGRVCDFFVYEPNGSR